MKVFRSNAFAELHGATPTFLRAITKHLAVPLERVERASDGKIKTGARYGSVFWHKHPYEEGVQAWGSLVRADGRVPAGLATHVMALAKHYGEPCEYFDIRQRPMENVPWWSVKASWRPYQDEVQKEIIRFGCGVLEMPPRAGKTLTAARAIDALALPTLYIAPSVMIVAQTYKVFCKHFGSEMVSRLDGGATADERDLSKPIVIATVQSAMKQDPEFLKTRQVLVIDEFHHAAADSYHLIGERCENAYYRIGLTGTHFRSGEDKLAMEAICSQVIFRLAVNDLVAGGYIAAPRIVYAPVRSARTKGEDWSEVYELGIVKNETRNKLVAHVANHLAGELGIPTLVLTKHREHADVLGKMISNSFVVKGGENYATARVLEDFEKERFQVLIGTTVIGEGIDLPRAGALVYASGGDATVQMIQSYYRPLTKHRHKSVGLIYDFQDEHHKTLKRHADARHAFAKKHIGNFAVWL